MGARLIEQWDEIAVLSFSNPGRANGVDPELVTELARAFRRAEEDTAVRAVILTGDGDYFCAGADISGMQQIFDERGIESAVEYMIDVWMPSVQRAALAIKGCTKATVAAVNGPATAGGLDFALACEYSVAVPDAKVGESYVNLGLLPVAAGIDHLLRRLKPGVARRMLLSGDVVTARELDVFDELVEPGELIGRAHHVADELSRAPRATRAAYSAAFAMSGGGFERQLAHALTSNAMLLRDPEVRERFAAVLQRGRKR